MMRALTVLAAALALVAQAAGAQSPALFDSHVHLWKGEDSLQAYEKQLKEGQLQVAGVGTMWFGGPNQALAGQLEQIRAGNDGIIARAAKHPKMMPIGTVHPYDGPAAVAELERIAARASGSSRSTRTRRNSIPTIPVC